MDEDGPVGLDADRQNEREVALGPPHRPPTRTPGMSFPGNAQPL